MHVTYRLEATPVQFYCLLGAMAILLIYIGISCVAFYTFTDIAHIQNMSLIEIMTSLHASENIIES